MNWESSFTANVDEKSDFLYNADPTNPKDPAYWKHLMTSSEMGNAVEASYHTESGYYLRINPKTGLKEMFISGANTTKEWIQNIMELPLLQTFDTEELPIGRAINMWSGNRRKAYAYALQDIARDEGVDVVYGHSRGAATMTDMRGDFVIIGLDGAAVIGEDRPYVNLIQGGLKGAFDSVIAYGHKGNIRIPGTKFHKVMNSIKRKTPKKRKPKPRR